MTLLAGNGCAAQNRPPGLELFFGSNKVVAVAILLVLQSRSLQCAIASMA